MKARVVIGANFGDEGKGLMVDYLCSQGAGIVVRFNGGAQAGHTVVTPQGERHVFRHFSSGSFLEVPTYLSSYFVCNPILFFEERKQLAELGFRPDVYAHPDCLITTHVDMLINQHKEEARGTSRHGSCGIGFHETIVRSKVDELKITMGDLWNGENISAKLDEIGDQWSQFRIKRRLNDDDWKKTFIECCNSFAEVVQPMGIADIKDPVFEGAQGLQLDQDNKEFFPHLTHSSTGMKNVRVLCQNAGINDVEIYYVSRTYLTRHGAGPLPGEDQSLMYEDDTNMPSKFQGALRFAPMDYIKLKQRINADASGDPYKLVLTHCDQLEPDIEASLYASGPTRDHVSASLIKTAEVS